MIMKKLLALILVIVGLCPTMMGCVPETQTPAEPTGSTEPSVPNEIDQQAYKQFGNAVNVDVIRTMAEKLFSIDEQ